MLLVESPELTDPGFWEKILGREGVATTLIFGVFVFGLGFAWKVVLPLFKEWAAASIDLNKSAAEAVPRLTEALEKVAKDTGHLDPMARKIDAIHEKVVNGSSHGG